MPSARLAARPAVHPSGDSRRPYGRRPTLAALVAVIAFLGVLGAAIVSAGPAGAAVTPPAQGWNSTEAALPANAGTATTLGNVIISSSSCPAVNGCVSVGGYHDTGTLPWGVIETQNGTSWTETQAPEPSNAGTGGNQGFWFGSQNCGNSQPCRAVSCPSAGFCVAVGEFSDSAGFDQPVVDTLANGAWTSAQGALPSDAATDSTTVNPDAWLYSVSCSSSTSCVAVGTYRNTSDNVNGFVATLSGTTWSAQAAPLPSNANTTGSVLVAVSCPSATFCVGAGSYPDDTAGNPSNGWLVVDANGTWTGTTAPQPAGTGDDADGHQDSIESGVACPSAASCVATGHYADASAEQLAAHRHVERDRLDRPPGPGALGRQHGADLRAAGLGLVWLAVVVRGGRFLPEHLARHLRAHRHAEQRLVERHRGAAARQYRRDRSGRPPRRGLVPDPVLLPDGGLLRRDRGDGIRLPRHPLGRDVACARGAAADQRQHDDGIHRRPGSGGGVQLTCVVRRRGRLPRYERQRAGVSRRRRGPAGLLARRLRRRHLRLRQRRLLRLDRRPCT